ncbi:MAG: osmotically inducible protein OsmC [Bacteroidetes bacterium GWF2_43_63]|nr:MAG: osmotically inducible protein OsmC [Bacteroidetes bacterium GWE2_42_42]OFY55451.1 MAG: osmotically inducible protein OsmC [Bacteroidetes bacterium GWF2_43_63]HBG70306.1 osmotically inducible protein OsmC [Bacteroidales bacterium]HCB60309.1 osmotically inducible protein OsmC [Bacteroidales bacterium]HCY23579.1 osmotically inducible protein OsmC [Bacteroidales bacterium]
MTSKVQYVGELRTVCEHSASSSQIETDAPVDNHGKGEKFSPTDLLATSLASCMLTVMGLAGQTIGFSIDGATASVEKFMGTDPRRIVKIRIIIDFPGIEYSEKEKQIIRHAARMCPVGQSLHHDIEQEIIFNFEEK